MFKQSSTVTFSFGVLTSFKYYSQIKALKFEKSRKEAFLT
jgi:hypothetical protein